MPILPRSTGIAITLCVHRDRTAATRRFPATVRERPAAVPPSFRRRGSGRDKIAATCVNARGHGRDIPVQVLASMRVAYVRVWQHAGQ